ncbi:hypothetical protein Q5741_07770 [Paenibacillus sp. JX-17]|uniref:Lipoprotein n=1 Tax=Paenibacillus lacisoli TaxID=3064525 RepID=A0ABT9CAM5_9BACL|nr:hypothetical protein [Paenibacillus sp. JX-17]MDO7906314.1 hypothetical protein [Paenibacillus sp. JX-17]
MNRTFRSITLTAALAASLAMAGCSSDSDQTQTNKPADSPGSASQSDNASGGGPPSGSPAGDTETGSADNGTGSPGSGTTSSDTAGSGSTDASGGSSSGGGLDASFQVIQQVKEQLKMNHPILPYSFALDHDQQTAARIMQNSTDAYQVMFYSSSKALPVNDPSLEQEGLPVTASFAAKTYANSASTAKAFPDITLNKSQDLDLGHGIKGYTEGAAGHAYLNWQEGRWLLQIESLSQDQMDQQGIAKKMVDYLETHRLPVPKDKGIIQVSYPQGAKNVQVLISWQEGSTVYQLNTSKVPLDALEMAVSTK